MGDVLTLGEVIDKLSINRSKIAMAQLLQQYLKVNYLPNKDGVPPEMSVMRKDGTRVSEPHINAMIADLGTLADGLAAEMERYESLRAMPVRVADEEKPAAPVPIAQPKLTRRKPKERP